MGAFVVLLALCLCYGSVRGDIQNLDDILKESIGKAMKTTIDGVDLSGLTVTFVEKVDYGEPDEISDEIVETITQEYENPSNEETTEEFEETYDHENQMSWILEDGLLTSSSPKIVASVTGQKGFDINAVITDEAQKTQEKTATKTLTKKATVKLPPNSKVTVAWNIVEKEVEIPWEVDVEISGDVGLTCDKKCSKPKSIEWLLRRKQLPEDIFTIEDGKLKFTASGTLVTVLAYSDALKIETEAKEGETTEEEAAETEGEASETAEPEIEEEPTEDDVAVADEDPKLAFVKGVLSIASDNLEPDSEYQPWIKMAGGIAELSAGNTDDPQVYLDIAESAIDIVNSEKGQAVIEKLKNVTKKVVNKVRGKAKTETEKCKPTGRGRRNRKPGCPSRKQPPTPKPTPGRPPARPTRRPRPTRKPRTQASTRPSNGRTQKTRKPRRTRKPRTPRPRRTTVRSRTTKARRTTKRTTKRQTTKKPKKTTTKKNGRRNRG